MLPNRHTYSIADYSTPNHDFRISSPSSAIEQVYRAYKRENRLLWSKVEQLEAQCRVLRQENKYIRRCLAKDQDIHDVDDNNNNNNLDDDDNDDKGWTKMGIDWVPPASNNTVKQRHSRRVLLPTPPPPPAEVVLVLSPDDKITL